MEDNEELKEPQYEFFGYSVIDDIESFGGPITYSMFHKRTEDYDLTEEADNIYGSHDEEHIEMLIEKYYSDYIEIIKIIMEE